MITPTQNVESFYVALNWIRNHMSPGDIFADSVISRYARHSLHIDDVYSKQEINDHVSDTQLPSEVFDKDVLAQWAKDHVYIRGPKTYLRHLSIIFK